MRSLLFKMLIFAMLLMPVTVYADTSVFGELPTIPGRIYTTKRCKRPFRVSFRLIRLTF